MAEVTYPVLSEHRFVNSAESSAQSMSVVARTTAIPDNLIRVDVEWLKPEDMDWFDAWAIVSRDEMARQGIKPYQDNDYGDWRGIVDLGRDSGLHRSDLPIYLARLGFGFSFREPVVNDDGSVLTIGAHTYPAVSRINQTLDLVFGSKDGGLRAREYQGAKFPSIDAMRAFVEDGVFLVASEQPYQAHDIRAHMLGYIGMGAELVETLRERTAVYLDRHDSGVERFEPFEKTNGYSEGNIASLFSPSRGILVAIWQALDALSGGIPGRTIFAEEKDEYRREQDLARLMDTALGGIGLRNDRQPYDTIYNFLNLEFDDFDKHAAATDKRFAKIQEVLA